MLTFLWAWLVLGCLAALVHMMLVNLAHLDEIIDDEDAKWMYKLVPYYVLAGPLSLLYMFYVAYIANDSEE